MVFGFFKIDKKNNILDAVDVDNPPVIINTRGMWLDIPRLALEILSKKHINIAGSIHAAEHAVLSLFPNFVISMPGMSWPSRIYLAEMGKVMFEPNAKEWAT